MTVLGSCSSAKEEQSELEREVTAGACTLDEQTDDGSEHVTDPAFEVDPPAGGDHLDRAAPAGVYAEGQVPDGNLVHSMEHGFVVLWYKPGISEADLAALTEIHEEHAESTLLVPRSSLDVAVAVTAWHKRLLCPSLERERVVAFVRGYRDKGPETGFM